MKQNKNMFATTEINNNKKIQYIPTSNMEEKNTVIGPLMHFVRFRSRIDMQSETIRNVRMNDVRQKQKISYEIFGNFDETNRKD